MMRQWKLMTGRDCDELRMAWVMTYVLPVIATRRFSPRLRTSDNGNRVTDRWRTIVTKTSNGIREAKISPRSNKQRDMVVKTHRRQRAGVSLRTISNIWTGYFGTPARSLNLNTPRWVITRVLPGTLRGDLCYNSWSLSHPGYLYPGTTPVMIKLDHNRSCPWVYIAQVTKAPTTRVPWRDRERTDSERERSSEWQRRRYVKSSWLSPPQNPSWA